MYRVRLCFMIQRDLWEIIGRLEEEVEGEGGGGKMLSASYQSASSGFRLLGKIPAGAITEQKREVQHPVERPYVNTVTKVTVRILIFCVPRNMGNV